MPELPEVETSRRGIAPHIEGQTIRQIAVREPRLRWPVPPELSKTLPGLAIERVERRAKYLLLTTARGSLILHLGMSGSLRILPPGTPPQKHDHVDLVFDDCLLRLRDPRRFGALLWAEDPMQHQLLVNLGPEPLSAEFDGEHLWQQAQRRRCPVKNLVMDGGVVVGVGNIYASESLYLAGIHPNRACNRVSLARYRRLAEAIRQVLQHAIEQGGTTLRDFQRQDGSPGYFEQQLKVYGRAGEPCPGCGRPISQRRIGQRSSFYCSHCQR